MKLKPYIRLNAIPQNIHWFALPNLKLKPYIRLNAIQQNIHWFALPNLKLKPYIRLLFSGKYLVAFLTRWTLNFCQHRHFDISQPATKNYKCNNTVIIIPIILFWRRQNTPWGSFPPRQTGQNKKSTKVIPFSSVFKRWGEFQKYLPRIDNAVQ